MAGSSPRSGHVELIVSRTGHPDRRLLLKPGVIRLGRAEDNDLVLPDIGVSRRHARIIVDDTGVTVEDLGSGNGTLFQGRPMRKKRIEDNDVLNIDPFNLRFRVRAPGARHRRADTLNSGPRLILMTEAGVADTVYPIPPTGLTLGRATSQTVVLNDPGASRQHLVLIPRQGGCWLQDNRSANGTFVNDERVYQHMVQHGDVVRIGHTMFRLDTGGPSTASDPFSELWDESGVHPRVIQDDDALPPTFSPSMPGPMLSVTQSNEQTAALQESSGRGQGRLLAVVGLLLTMLVLFVIAAAVAVPRLLATPDLLTGAPPPPPPELGLPKMITSASAGQRMVIGRALMAAGRPLEAATPLYQALKTEPGVEELEQLGYAACEAAAVAVLAAEITRADRTASLSLRDAQKLARAAEQASDDALLELRTQLSSALQLYPGDSRLVRAQGSIDSRLAGLATAKVALAAEAAEPAASWKLLEEALVLSPTTGAAASAAWTHIAMGRTVARPLIEQAMWMEVVEQDSEASRLYATAAARLPGQSGSLERLARARMDTLAR